MEPLVAVARSANKVTKWYIDTQLEKLHTLPKLQVLSKNSLSMKSPPTINLNFNAKIDNLILGQCDLLTYLDQKQMSDQ